MYSPECNPSEILALTAGVPTTTCVKAIMVRLYQLRQFPATVTREPVALTLAHSNCVDNLVVQT